MQVEPGQGREGINLGGRGRYLMLGGRQAEEGKPKCKWSQVGVGEGEGRGSCRNSTVAEDNEEITASVN